MAQNRTKDLRDEILARVVLTWRHNEQRYGITQAELWRWIQSGPLAAAYPHRGSIANAVNSLVIAGDVEEFEGGYRPTTAGAARWWASAAQS